MPDLRKIATVLELTADYVEQNERAKEAASAEARASRIDKIATAHLAAHGEELPEAMRGKLARADATSLEVLEELLGKQANVGAPDALGAAADPETPDVTSKKQAADVAWNQFGNWITSE